MQEGKIFLEPYNTKNGNCFVKASVVTYEGKLYYNILTPVPAPTPFVFKTFLGISLDHITLTLTSYKKADGNDYIEAVFVDLSRSILHSNVSYQTDMRRYESPGSKTLMAIKEKIIFDHFLKDFPDLYDKELIKMLMMPNSYELMTSILLEVKNLEEQQAECKHRLK